MDITKIFKSKARQAIFRLYFTNPDKSFYLRELERELYIPVSMLRKELMKLEQDGLFLSSRKGNLLYYSLDKGYPLYRELKTIVFKTVGVQGALSKMLIPLKSIKAAFIYGSYAKNEDNAKSDVDLFLIGNPDENKLVEMISKLEKELKREINYNIYTNKDIKKKKRLKDPFIKEVAQSKKIFLIGGENDF
ncbi:MAG: nucleotidyltransferase domain-containing protein [Candidatus Omnitrophica bacterium]|nr:nucleotidyltransferase domain-containing protein [Candidatus Omnitrophota bacterium]